MFVDSHCHLDFDLFEKDREECIARAQKAGIQTMLTISTHITRFPEILKLTNSSDYLYCTIGVHPHQVRDEPKIDCDQISKFANNPKVIGIGETGLDYFYENSPRKEQKDSFLQHIAASRMTGLPLIVHSRDADEDMEKILEDEMKKKAFPCVLHCFSSSERLARCALSLGVYISISGIVTFKNATELRKIVKNIPLDRLLIETDSPFLAPVPYRGKRNEPSYIIYTAKKVAELKDISINELEKVTTNNFFCLFSKARKPGQP